MPRNVSFFVGNISQSERIMEKLAANEKFQTEMIQKNTGK